MIFSLEGHIEKIMRGEKTQTRRDSGKYMVGKTYALQPGRTKPGDPRGRILITHKWSEDKSHPSGPNLIHVMDAEAEGGYSCDEYEDLYEGLHPGWETRWAYEFKFVKFVPALNKVRVYGGRVEDIEDEKLRNILLGPYASQESKGERTK